ncbi:hypothetical protein LDENG_00234330, partial [Lucifuga dentata]
SSYNPQNKKNNTKDTKHINRLKKKKYKSHRGISHKREYKAEFSVVLLKDHTAHFACLSLIYLIFIYVMLLTIISQRIKPYFSFPDILQNLLIFQNQIFK